MRSDVRRENRLPHSLAETSPASWRAGDGAQRLQGGDAVFGVCEVPRKAYAGTRHPAGACRPKAGPLTHLQCTARARRADALLSLENPLKLRRRENLIQCCVGGRRGFVCACQTLGARVVTTAAPHHDYVRALARTRSSTRERISPASFRCDAVLVPLAAMSPQGARGAPRPAAASLVALGAEPPASAPYRRQLARPPVDAPPHLYASRPAPPLVTPGASLPKSSNTAREAPPPSRERSPPLRGKLVLRVR